MKLSGLLLVGLVLTGQAAPSKISDFELRDQHGRSRQYSFPKSKVTVMTIADQGGSEQLEPWIWHVHGRFGNRIDIDGVADVSQVPGPLRGIVRAVFRNQLSYSILLDWNGAVVRQFAYEKGSANVYVIDKDGHVKKHLSGPATGSMLNDLERAVHIAISGGRAVPD